MKDLKINIVDFWNGFDYKKHGFFILLSKRYNIILSENPDAVIYSVYGYKHYNYNCIKIFFSPEYISPDFNECDYAIGYDWISFDKRYLRFPNYHYYSKSLELAKVKHIDYLNVLKSKSRFCNFIYSNDFKYRSDFFLKLNELKRVDSGGSVLNNLGYRIVDKLNFQKEFKFSIAFENASAKGYTTEKILEAFAARTVPIYWGNPDIHLDFNKKSFINLHDFKNENDAISHILEVDSSEEKYLNYLKEPIFTVQNQIPNDKRLYVFFDYILDNLKFKMVASNYWQSKSSEAKRLGFKLRTFLRIPHYLLYKIKSQLRK